MPRTPKIVVVGSVNPAKVAAAQDAFDAFFPDQGYKCFGFTAHSGVSDQPMSDEEALRGAKRRAEHAVKLYDAIYHPKDQEPAFAVGIEGTLCNVGESWWDCGWMHVIRLVDGLVGQASTIRMPIPPIMLNMINEGMELGQVDDVIFDVSNSKQGIGHFGLVTNNLLSRAGAYRDGIISALSVYTIPQYFKGKMTV